MLTTTTAEIETVKLIKQIYPNENRSLYYPIKLSTTTHISEMIQPYQRRILGHKNKMIVDRSYLTKTSIHARQYNKFCPMIYSKVLCHACYQEIKIRDLYLSKNGERGRSKFYHISCAEIKNII